MEFFKYYEMPISLWDVIIENVAPNEIYEVKSYLGDDLVDNSIELRAEISILVEIYNAYIDEQASGDSSKHFLPEPPEVRERLLKEINFFVKGIREQARSQGRNPDKILENRASDIIDYAYESSSSRPNSPHDSCLLTSRSSYRATPISDRINVNLLKEKLNYMEFEEVQNNLKQFLQDEVNQLNDDLSKILNVLYNDDTERHHSRGNKHSLSELKHERHELEQLLLQSSRPLSNTSAKATNSKHNQCSTANYNKPLCKSVSDGQTSNQSIFSSSVKSPINKLKPLENKDSTKFSSYVESPLDLGLPETSKLAYEQSTDRNNSSLNNSDVESIQSLSPNPISERTNTFNSAQKFRQRVLQNRKETLNY